MNLSATLQQSYDVSKTIMEKKAVNFYQAFKHMDLKRLRAITAIYAFCRYVDDIVDEYPEQDIQQKIENLDEIESIVIKIYNQEDVHFYYAFNRFNWLEAFVDTLSQFEISKESFLNQIRGQRSDLEFSHIGSFDELVKYSEDVAGSVGVMLMPIICEQPSSQMASICSDLGVAMQITNILRDIGEDIRERNRIYIPQHLLEEYQISNQDLLDVSLGKAIDNFPRLIALWEALATIAESKYQRFESYIQNFTKSAQLPLLLASRNYESILNVVRESKYQCFEERCYTKSVTRSKIFNEAKKHLKNIYRNEAV